MRKSRDAICHLNMYQYTQFSKTIRQTITLQIHKVLNIAKILKALNIAIMINFLNENNLATKSNTIYTLIL